MHRSISSNLNRIVRASGRHLLTLLYKRFFLFFSPPPLTLFCIILFSLSLSFSRAAISDNFQFWFHLISSWLVIRRTLKNKLNFVAFLEKVFLDAFYEEEDGGPSVQSRLTRADGIPRLADWGEPEVEKIILKSQLGAFYRTSRGEATQDLLDLSYAIFRIYLRLFTRSIDPS